MYKSKYKYRGFTELYINKQLGELQLQYLYYYLAFCLFDRELYNIIHLFLSLQLNEIVTQVI